MNKAIQEYAEAYAVYWAMGEPEEGKERERFLEAQKAVDATFPAVHADEDAAMLDWLESITKVNAPGTSTFGMKTDTKALFTILPAWNQEGASHSSLRESILAAISAQEKEGGQP